MSLLSTVLITILCISGLSYSTSWPEVPRRSLRSKYCDGRSAKQCFDSACNKLIEYRVNCSVAEIKNSVLDRLAWCPNFDVCFSDMAYRSTVCRLEPKLCINYACNHVGKLTNNKITCDKDRSTNYVTDILKNCYLPKLRSCLHEINGKPAEKQKDQNVREMTKDQRLSAIRLPFSGKRLPAVVSPTICRKNVIQCLPYACSKMQKDYRKNCNDGVFREQLLAGLRKCDGTSIDFCLVRFYYENFSQ